MNDQLDIQVLGGVSIHKNGNAITDFTTQKEIALLVYIAAIGGTHQREVLAEFFWEDRSQAQTLANLRYVLAQLRKHLDDYLCIDRRTVCMKPDADWRLDVRRFEDHLDSLKQPDQTTLETALGYYAGDFLAGFTVDSAAFEVWASMERERLRLKYMKALEQLATYYLGQKGTEHRGLDFISQLLALDPLRESVYRQKMKLLAQAGHLGAALATYERCVAVLADELGMQPDTETIALYDSIRAANGSQLAEVDLPEPDNPYKGLRAFQPTDAQDYFGQETLVEKLIQRMTEQDKHARFLALVGPSGSGKSSVIKAGVIPALWRGDIAGSENWLIVDMVPDDRPLNKLAVAISKVTAHQPLNLLAQLEQGESGLLDVADLILTDEQGELVIVIDQFEELFTLVEDEPTRSYFINLIYKTVTSKHSQVRMVVTLRADFFDRPLMYPNLAELMRDRTEMVLPLTASELESAIRNPAKRVGVHFEEGLVATITTEVSDQPGTLPLLQYALTELFERRDHHSLTHTAYLEMGGTVGALAMRADKLFTDLSQEAQQLTRQIFLRLVSLGEGTEDTRRRVPRSELAAITENEVLLSNILDVFTNYRLVSLDFDPTTHAPTVELAHEAILREWERLRNWLHDSRDHIRQHRLLLAVTQEWERAGRESSYLLSGSRLAQFANWHDQTDVALTLQEQTYLETSAAEETRRTLRRRRVRVFAFAAISLVAVVMTILALVANGQRTRAEDEKDRAEIAEQEALRQASIGLASQSRLELDSGEEDRAILLALEALEHYPYTAEAEQALADAVEAYVPVIELASGFTIDGTWSHDGERIVVSIGGTGTSRFIISPYTGEILETPQLNMNRDCQLTEGAWSPDDDRFVATYATNESEPCPPTIWDADSWEPLLSLPTHEGWGSLYEDYEFADWSSDGSTILTAGPDGIARLSNAETGDELLTFTQHTAAILDAEFSPSGKLAVTTSSDGTVRIWDTAIGEEQQLLTNLMGVVNSVSWSPDEMYLATASSDGVARIWDIATGELVLAYPGHTAAVKDIAWSPDGKWIATTSDDKTAQIWNAVTGDELLTLPGTSESVMWSPDGKRFTASATGRIRVLDLSRRHQITLVGHDGMLFGAHWSPDGMRIATSGRGDDTIRIWDALSGEQQLVLEQPGSMYISWSPDSTRVVAPGTDSMARIWDATTGEILLEISAPPDTMFFMTYWSPDGSKIAVATAALTDSAKPRLFLVDAVTGQTLAETESQNCLLHQPSWNPDVTRFVTSCYAPDLDRYPDNNSPAYIWDAESGELIMELKSQHGATMSVAYSPDGERIVTGYFDGTIIIWNADTGTALRTLSRHSEPVRDADWSQDGRRFVTGDNSGLVIVWDVKTGVETMIFEVQSAAESVRWSPDGRHILVGGLFPEPVIRRAWSSTQALINEAYECCVTRQLTPEEREQFGLPSRGD